MNLPLGINSGTFHSQVQQECVEGLDESSLGSRPVSDAQEAVSSNGAALAPAEPPSDEQRILLFYATGGFESVQQVAPSCSACGQ